MKVYSFGLNYLDVEKNQRLSSGVSFGPDEEEAIAVVRRTFEEMEQFKGCALVKISICPVPEGVIEMVVNCWKDKK